MTNFHAEAPQITTIITTFNRSAFLKKAILSILNQSYPNFTLVILDNHSTDDTEAVVTELQSKDPRIRYIRHSSNIGMMKNYEYGFCLLETPYFHFLSDDDYVLPEFYSAALQAFAKHPDIGFYSGSTKIVSTSNETIRVPNNLWSKEGYWSKKSSTMEMIGKYPVPTSIVFSKKILSDTSPDFSNTLHWDSDFLLHLSIKYPVYIDQRILGIFISHDHSFSRMPEFSLIFDSLHKILSRVQEVEGIDLHEKAQIKNAIKQDFIRIFKASLIEILTLNELALIKQRLSLLRSEYNLFSSFLGILLLYSYSKYFPFGAKTIHVLRECKRLLRRNFKKFKPSSMIDP